MADPKEKPDDKPAPVYTTPPLNEQGAPLDTRFQKPEPPKEETPAPRATKSEASEEETDDKPKGSKKRR